MHSRLPLWLTAQELLGELTRRGLATTGTAAVLRARLQRHYEAEARRQSGATGFEEQIGALDVGFFLNGKLLF